MAQQNTLAVENEVVRLQERGKEGREFDWGWLIGERKTNRVSTRIGAICGLLGGERMEMEMMCTCTAAPVV
jgi:hypothetical protein